MTEKTFDFEKLVIGKNTEGFTTEDYLRIPSASTVLAEQTPKLKRKYLYANTPILNQERRPSCTITGLTKAENEADFFDNGRILDDVPLRKKALERGADENGWYLSKALQLFKDEGYIKDWYLVSSPEEAQRALAQGHMLYTGSHKCDWAEMNKTGRFVRDYLERYGHAFACTGIDMDKGEYIFPNSWGDNRGDKGFFRATFEEVEKYFFTVVAIIDKDDDSISNDMEDSRNMTKKGIWNGKLPNESLTKLHAVFMVMRAFFDEFDNEKALEKALKKEIVHNVNGPLTKRYFLYMVYKSISEIKNGNEKHIPQLAVDQGIISSLDDIDKPLCRYYASLIIARVLKMLKK